MRQEQSETRANAGRIDHPNTIRDRSTTENPSLRPATPIHLFPDGPLEVSERAFADLSGRLRDAGVRGGLIKAWDKAGRSEPRTLYH